MADAAVLLARLLPLIEKKVREELNLFLNAENQARTLSQKLEEIRKFLADAELKLIDDHRVRAWLQDLQEIAYNIDDALEDWEYENIKQKYEEESGNEAVSESLSEKVCAVIQTVCSCFKHTARRRTIALDFDQILQTLGSLSKQNEEKFHFLPKLESDSQNKKQPRDQTSSFHDVSKIHGRDLDKNAVMDKLLSESSSSEGEGGTVKVVSIVAVGGMGKTALAQLVFNQDKVKEHFNEKIWVCVSDMFSEIKIAGAILKVIDKDSSPGDSSSQLESLLQKIAQLISSKKFLLVLDDVWIEENNKWNSLKECLKGGAKGSRILVTSRNEKVAKILGSVYIHTLEPLEDTHSCSVLRHLAFEGKDESEREMLETTSLEIAKKCRGLPLIVTTVGSLLRFKSCEEWESILESGIWGEQEVRKDIFPFLTLSYDELQPAIRRCFSYCAIFPKDTEMNVDELVRIWMAQGFLSSSSSSSGGSDKDMEIVGQGYFKDLAMRSFFQDFEKDYSGRIFRCKMHDMVHDFAQFLTENECLIVPVEQTNGEASMVSSKDARHLTVVLKYEDDNSPTHIPSCESERLRSFVCYSSKILVGKSLAPDLLSRLQKVRLLTLYACGLQEIPEEIGSLIHIRYLDLSMNLEMVELPETICDLYHLETLGIEGCYKLPGLPRRIDKLKNLRHILNTYNGYIIFKFPQAFENFTNLRRLGTFGVTEQSSNKLAWLKEMKQLRGRLEIYIDGDIVGEMDAKEARLEEKKSIQELILSSRNERVEVIEALKPHRNLEMLSLTASHFPKWIVTLTRLKSLIVFLPGVESAGDLLPDVGKLPFLEDLTLRSVPLDRLCIKNTSSSDAFPKLKKLKFDGCFSWDEWEDTAEGEDGDGDHGAIMPGLQELRILKSPYLRSLPHKLLKKASGLKSLVIEESMDLWRRYYGMGGQYGHFRPDYAHISHIPNVVIKRPEMFT